MTSSNHGMIRLNLRSARQNHAVSYRPSARPRDIDVFLAGYPDQISDPSKSANLQFYRNEIKMKPESLTYEDFMYRYQHDYYELESNHGYIQWLFPIREKGLNSAAQPLQVHEIQAMSADPEVMRRLKRSYIMMLGFYGIEMERDGRLVKSQDYKQAFINLRSHPHNLLRITRILKHLSEFPQLQPYAAPFVLFWVAQHSEGNINFVDNTMHSDSLERWWSNCFRNDSEREEVRKIVMSRGGCGERIWGEEDYKAWYDSREERRRSVLAAAGSENA